MDVPDRGRLEEIAGGTRDSLQGQFEPELRLELPAPGSTGFCICANERTCRSRPLDSFGHPAPRTSTALSEADPGESLPEFACLEKHSGSGLWTGADEALDVLRAGAGDQPCGASPRKQVAEALEVLPPILALPAGERVAEVERRVTGEIGRQHESVHHLLMRGHNGRA